jgi:indole-3-glycerol phosphate synthase
VPTSLERILADTRAALPALRGRGREVERLAADRLPPPAFASGLRGPTVALIAEVKRRSPSAGEIRATLDPVGHALAYAEQGASAISVLTDGPHFGGSIADLEAVADRVRVPVLRKDFILDELQIAEARAAGAAAVLLIVRALAESRLRELLGVAARWGLETLVEVHDARELDVALDVGAPVIGVNSRNLDTFSIDIEAAWPLLRRIPADRVAIAESGMATAADVALAARQGADAVLIGTALSSASDPRALVTELVGTPRRGR